MPNAVKLVAVNLSYLSTLKGMFDPLAFTSKNSALGISPALTFLCE